MLPPVYVLYCPELAQRKAATAAHMAARGVVPVWWRGVHAVTWGLRTVKTYDHDGVSGYTIAPGHAANIVGHYFLWQHLHLSGVPEAVVLEDDAVLPKDFAARFAAFREALPADWQFAYMGLAEAPEKVTPKITDRFPGGLVRLIEPYGVHAYLVRDTALPTLLEGMSELRAHTDIQLYQNVLRPGRLVWYAACPDLIGQRSQGAAGVNEWASTL